MSSPKLNHAYELNFAGDWGQANFHRICGWLTQEFCDRAPGSRTKIWSLRDGGIETMQMVQRGELDLCIATPSSVVAMAPEGRGLFEGRALPDLVALAVLPQVDRLAFAIDPKFGVKSFAQIRKQKLPLRIATSVNDGTNFIGYVAGHFLEAHGLSHKKLKEWGGEVVGPHRPEQSMALFETGKVDAVLQEAIMTPWWQAAVEKRKAVMIPAEDEALTKLETEQGFKRATLPVGWMPGQKEPCAALDFSDFSILVRRDMPDDIAYLLTWCLVETRETLERQYKHISPERSPLSYPLVPERMAKTPVPLHPAAERYYKEAGHLAAKKRKARA